VTLQGWRPTRTASSNASSTLLRSLKTSEPRTGPCSPDLRPFTARSDDRPAAALHPHPGHVGAGESRRARPRDPTGLGAGRDAMRPVGSPLGHRCGRRAEAASVTLTTSGAVLAGYGTSKTISPARQARRRSVSAAHPVVGGGCGRRQLARPGSAWRRPPVSVSVWSRPCSSGGPGDSTQARCAVRPQARACSAA
jgi:hypothetical protein